MIAVDGQQIPIEVSFDPGLLFVAMKVRDVTAGYPGTLVGSAVPMVEFDTGSYGASFTGTAGKNYVLSKAVYTDGTYATRDPNYSPGSDSVQVIPQSTAPTVDQITSAVLNALLVDYTVPGSVAAAIDRAGAPQPLSPTVQAFVEEATQVEVRTQMTPSVMAIVTSVVDLKPC